MQYCFFLYIKGLITSIIADNTVHRNISDDNLSCNGLLNALGEIDDAVYVPCEFCDKKCSLDFLEEHQFGMQKFWC